MTYYPNPEELKIKVEAELGKRSFYEFLKLVWNEISGEDYTDGWHIKLLCNYLEKTVSTNEGFYRGHNAEIHNLIINIPTRHSKSTIVSIFPAWVWITKPWKTFMFSSYSEGVAVDSAKRCRTLILSDFYQERWSLKLNTSQESYFENNKKGWFRAVGAGGAITGRGADWLICDDPISAEEINSETIRVNRNNWYKNTWSNRVRNPKTACRILIQQRLHQDDTTGMLLDGEMKYEHVVLPALYDGKRYVSKVGLDDPRTEIGEPLWPERYGQTEIEEAKNQMTEIGFESQFQQRTTPVAGNIFQKDWFKRRVMNTDIIARFISIDSAFSDKKTADYSAFVIAELTSRYELFIREVFRDKLTFPQLQKKAEYFIEKYSYRLERVIIEGKASGLSLAQSMKESMPEEFSDLIFIYQPGQSDKVQRGYQASLYCNKGCILFPPHTEDFPWIYDFESELFQFPSVKHDDMTDGFTQLIIYLEHYLSVGLRERSEVN